MYGNTHVIAASIADGLRSTHEVTFVPATKATQGLVADADLVVAGGLELDPDAGGPRIRDWLEDVTGGHGITAAAFDTRLTGVPRLHRPGQQRHRLAAAPARLPPARRSGELPGRPAAKAAGFSVCPYPAVWLKVIPLRDLGLCAARAFRGVLVLPGRIPVGRGETATSALGQDGRRSPRNRNPREAEAGSFPVL
jgi:hypothetical protein